MIERTKPGRKKSALSPRRAKLRKTTGLPPRPFIGVVDSDGNLIECATYTTPAEAAQAIIDEDMVEHRGPVRLALYVATILEQK